MCVCEYARRSDHDDDDYVDKQEGAEVKRVVSVNVEFKRERRCDFACMIKLLKGKKMTMTKKKKKKKMKKTQATSGLCICVRKGSSASVVRKRCRCPSKCAILAKYNECCCARNKVFPLPSLFLFK